MKSYFISFAVLACVYAGCEREGEGECPPNASCAPPCARGRVHTCTDEHCPAGQVNVDQCLEGYAGFCACEDPGDRCAALDCAAGFVCFDGECLKRQKCGAEVCEPGWSCRFGQCTQTVATELNRPVTMQIADDVLYLANGGTLDEDGVEGPANLSAVAVSGGEVRRLAESDEPIRNLLVAGDEVYWLSGGDEQQLRRIPRDQGAAKTVLSGLHAVDRIALERDAWYWMERLPDTESVQLMAAPIGGGSPRTLLARDAVSSGPVIVDGRAYWIEREREFVRASLDDLAVEPLGRPADRSLQLHVFANEGTAFYFGWANQGWTGAATYGEDERTIEKLSAASTSGTPVAIVADGEHVYTLIQTADRSYTSLDRAPRSIPEGSEPKYTRLHGGSAPVTAIAVDDTAVYLGVPDLHARDDGREDVWQVVRIRKRW